MSQFCRFLTIFCLLQVERHQKESHIRCQANKNTALLIPVIVSSVTDGQVGEGLVSHILLLVVSIIAYLAITFNLLRQYNRSTKLSTGRFQNYVCRTRFLNHYYEQWLFYYLGYELATVGPSPLAGSGISVGLLSAYQILS